jgi:uncharacterized protein
MRDKINWIKKGKKNKNNRDLYRHANEFNKAYQPRINFVKDNNGDLLAISHNISKSRKKCFYHLLNVRGVYDVRQTEMNATEPLVPASGCFEVKFAIEKPKRHKSPGTGQIPSELIQAWSNILRSVIHKFTDSIWQKEPSQQWKGPTNVSIYEKGDKSDGRNYKGILFYLLLTAYKSYLTFFWPG